MSNTTMLGLDFGSSTLKWTLMERGHIQKSDAVRLPENLMRDNRITSTEVMAEQVQAILKQGRVGKRPCAVVLPSEAVIVRRLTMPYMTVEQLLVNLPYEFHDYMQDDKDHYYFDYAVVDTKKDEKGVPTELDLLGAAVRKETIENYRRMLRKAGLKLKRAVPACLAYGNVIRAYEAAEEEHPQEYCIVDMGHQSIRLYFYRGSVFDTSRVIEYGGMALDALIADAAAVDPHLAAEYKQVNYAGALDIPACRDLYNRVAMEIMRAVNFYGFNTPDSNLRDIYLTGGLSHVEAMVEEIGRTVDLIVHPMEDLLPDGVAGQAGRQACPTVLGALLQGDGR